ncbi:MAG: hypothetical protein ABI867_14205 [Kofleriaceae bacterium]
MKFLALFVVLAPAVAHAEEVDSPMIESSATYSVDFGSHVRWFGDTSAAILSTEPIAGPRVTIGRSLTGVKAPLRDVSVGVFARYTFATTQGTFFQNLTTQIDQHELGAGLRFDAPLWWRFRVIGQAELGMARTALTVTEADQMTTPVDDHAWAPYVAATLGTDIAIYQGPRFRLSLGMDLGYTASVPVDLRALPGDRPDEDLSIPTDYVSIGKLDTRGFTYSMAFRGAF